MNEVTAARKAAVLGSPVAHSRSPQLHLAAYRALGLDDWTYDRIECTADELPALVAGFGPEWVGVSVTMPGKFAALRFADERSARAELIGSANTLVRTEHGWRLILGRGLDIFKKGSGSHFDLNTRRQEFRQVLAFGITYIREQEGAL